MGTLTHDLIHTDNLNTLPAADYTEMIKRGILLAKNQRESDGFVPENGTANEKYDAEDWVSLATNLAKKSNLSNEDTAALKTATQYALAASSKEANNQLAKISNETTHSNLEKLIDDINRTFSNSDLLKATALLHIAKNTNHNIISLNQTSNPEKFQNVIRDFVNQH